MGVILILGCSEDGVNGEYYGVGECPSDYTLFKKNKDEADSLSILRKANEDEPDRSEDNYDLCYYREENDDIRSMFGYDMYTASGWDRDETGAFDQWTMNRYYKQKVGAKMRPPMSFVFRFS